MLDDYKTPQSRDLEKKLKALEEQPKQPERDVPNDNRGMAVGMRMSIDLVAIIFVSVFIGYQLDRYFETLPLFLLILFFLGIITGFYNLYRTAKSLEAPEGSDGRGNNNEKQ